MAGHNKWSSIKHKKAKTDAQRGKIFSKLAREIMMATKLGGQDPDMNPRLRLALQNAKSANMPNDNINRAIKKGAGGGDETNLTEIQYEAYAQHGIGLIINTLTDNVNRTISNIRTIVNKGGANMAEKGSVSYLFENKGLFIIENTDKLDTVIDLSIENGAEDVERKEDQSIEITCPPNTFEEIKLALEKESFEITTSIITKIPTNFITISESDAEKVISLIENIEDDDDVQEVFANFEIKN